MVDPDQDPPEAICGSAEVGALAHLYRAEVYRSTIWRQRLDMTTNWAVVSTGIAFSVSFANEQASPLPIVLVGLLSALFLILEARRYRYFFVWKFRARMIEITNYVPILLGKGAQIPLDKGTALSDDYMHPRHRISMMRAVGRRLRRNYGWLFAIQGVAYFAKIGMHPTDVSSWEEFLYRAHIGPVPGWLCLLAGIGFHITWIVFAIYTRQLELSDNRITSDYLDPEIDADVADEHASAAR
ncbi:MAG: DUF2270 domain-containing protein [Pseudomonadota bacterium]